MSRLEDVPAFLSNIRRGRPAPPGLVEEVQHRLDAIGGSPLMRITEEQGRALAARVGRRVDVCARLWEPYPGDVLAALAEKGVRRVLSLPLAPQSVHVYHAAVEEAAGPLGIEVVKVPAWGLEPALLDAFVETIEEARSGLDPALTTALVLTAHSLPLRVLRAGDPYEAQFREMAEAVAARAGDWHSTHIAFQSQGASAEPWLGPSLEDTMKAVRGQGVDQIVVAPIGFLADHVETLYDLDVDAARVAKELGFSAFGRARAVGARPRLVDALAEVASRASAAG